MKVELDYQTFKTICLAMAETVRPMGFDEIICVMRGGMSASHIISKALSANNYFLSLFVLFRSVNFPAIPNRSCPHLSELF